MRRTLRAFAVSAAIVLASVVLAAPLRAPVQAQAVSAPPTIETVLQSGTGIGASDLAPLRRFYAARQFRRAWFDEHGPNADGKAALTVLGAAGEDGLDLARYNYDDVSKPLAATDGATLAYRDIALSVAVLRYASDMLDGQQRYMRIDSDVDLPPSGYDTATGMAQALDLHTSWEFLTGLPPLLPDYAPLKAALAQYRAIAKNGGWGTFAARKSFTAATAGDETLSELQARLAFEDAALSPTTPASVAEMDAAIRRFQARNGLAPDGKVGAGTVELLNIPVATRVLQIAANLERLRWLPHKFESTYVLVNVPEAMLTVMEDGMPVLTSRVIVGRPHDRTPIFSAEITDIVANPPWIVPATIARHEILPKVKSDPDYLARHNMIVTDGQVQQLPGASNALGLLKLNVRDRFAVYLHDTPSRSLFARNERFLSHGCIRVQQIKPLASFALNGDIDSGLERLTAAIATTQTTHLAIPAPIPLYVVYETAFMSPQGLQFRRDIYGRDKRLIDAMPGAGFAQALPATSNCTRRT